MSRFSPGVQYRPAQALDFSPINDAINGVRAATTRDRQLAIQEQEAADRHAESERAASTARAERETWSHAAPLNDIADASVALSGPNAGRAPSFAPTRGPSSITEALDPSVATRSLVSGVPPRAAATPTPLLARLQSGLGITPTPTQPSGGALGLNASRERATPAPGDDPSDPQALKRALSAILPSYTSTDESGALRVYDPAQRVVNQAAPQMISQRLNEEYAQRKANEDLDRKAAPFIGELNPQSGKPFTAQEARALASNPAYAQFSFREKPEDKTARAKELAAFAAALKTTPDHFTFPTGSDAQGHPIVLRANTRTGEVEPTGSSARQTVANGGKLSQDEAYTSSHLGVLASTVRDIADKTAPSMWQKLASKNMLGNYTLTPEGQQYNANVDRAALSLAVIMEGPRGATPQRVEMVKKSFFPKPGDDDSTVKDKIVKLKVAMTGAKQKAGRGYEQMDPTLKSTVDAFLAGDESSGSRPSLADRVQALKAAGLSKEAARAQLAKEGYHLGGAQ